MEDNFKVPTKDILVPVKKKKSTSSEISAVAKQSQSNYSSNNDTEYHQQLEQRNKQLMEIKPLAEHSYKFEVIKNGVIIEYISDLQMKSCWRIGKLSTNDIQLEHPTISRFHAVLTYRFDIQDNDGEKGWYLFDLKSTHGCFVNRKRIPPSTYVRVRVGYILKFGCSTRYYIFHGPESDEAIPYELNGKEIKELKRKPESDNLKDSDGINWGMGDDADEETDLSVNPYATTNNEELFIEDPKKTLRGFFEREGLECEYKCDEISIATFVCKVELPLNDSNGHPIIAQVCHKGKKKDSVVQCALEACRILDRHGVLRQANHEPFRRPKPKSDSDDDDFLDRTGAIERKRLKKMKNNNLDYAFTYEELIAKKVALENEYTKIRETITDHRVLESSSKNLKLQQATMQTIDEDPYLEDCLDSFLEDARKHDEKDIKKLIDKSNHLAHEICKINSLINLCLPPVNLPPIQTLTNVTPTTQTPITANNANDSNVKCKKLLPLFGKRNSKNRYVLNASSNSEASSTSAAASSSTSAVPINTNVVEGIEEFDDDVEQPVYDTIDHNLKTNVEKEIVIGDTTSEERNTVDKLTVDDSTLESSQEKNLVALKDDNKIDLLVELNGDNLNEIKSIEIDSISQQQKKKRNRPRIRNEKSRENVDETEEIYDKEKVSEWLPPENQSGDGTTNLNSKYGY